MAKRNEVKATEDGFVSGPEASLKATFTMAQDQDGRRILHLQVPLDLDGLRIKPGAKAAYQYVSAWCDGVKGVRVGGNVFISADRLTPKVLDNARRNYAKSLEDAEVKSKVVAEIDKLG